MQVAAYVVELAIALGCLVICGMKGKWGFVVLGFILPVFWVIGAVKMAKPMSWWASRYYGDVAMSDSEQHFVNSRRRRKPADPS
jgi:hypothetical protein